MYKAQLTQTPQLTQKTSITPRLQQALKVLNMQQQELTQRLSQAVEENPFLDLEEFSESEEDDETTRHTEEWDTTPEWNEPEEKILTPEDNTVDIDWETDFEDRVSVSERINSKSLGH